MRNLLWKQSSSFLISPASTFVCVGQNFRSLLSILVSSSLRITLDKLTTVFLPEVATFSTDLVRLTEVIVELLLTSLS